MSIRLGAEPMRVVLSLLLFLAAAQTALAEDAFPLRDGDRVALVGNTFVERAQETGHLELALTLSAPEADVTFRNLGWSGDVVTGRARRYFGTTSDGFDHLMRHLDLVDPTVILVSYGTNEAFTGEAGRDEFLAGYGRLLDALSQRTGRIALVTSPPTDPGMSPAPELARLVNKELAAQVEELRVLAEERNVTLVDCFTPLHEVLSREPKPPAGWTTNGMHLTPKGYRLASAIILNAAAGRPVEIDAILADVRDWNESPERARLRQAIVKKNRLFFHRHRPENETYLRGFRKHEQGNNAEEIYAFEPLVQAMDQEIFALREALSE